MESIKLQLGSLTILVFITIVYVFRLIHYKRKVNFNFFLIFIVLSFIEIVFDGLTAYSVNNLDKFDHTFNLILHGIFLSSIDAVIFFVFLQVLTMTEMYPTKTINKLKNHISYFLIKNTDFKKLHYIFVFLWYNKNI